MTPTTRLDIGVSAPTSAEAIEAAKGVARQQGYRIRTVARVGKGDRANWWVVELVVM